MRRWLTRLILWLAAPVLETRQHQHAELIAHLEAIAAHASSIEARVAQIERTLRLDPPRRLAVAPRDPRMFTYEARQ